MINTVHEDDLAAWYQIPEPVSGISIEDFELEEDDLVFEPTGDFADQSDSPGSSRGRPDQMSAQRRFIRLEAVELNLDKTEVVHRQKAAASQIRWVLLPKAGC